MSCRTRGFVDDYRDNCVRQLNGPILPVSGEPEKGVKIGEATGYH